MRDAVLKDLNALPDVHTFCTYDPRVAAPDFAHEAFAITDEEDVWKQWNKYIADADAVLPIAPETNGLLLRLTELVSSQHKVLLGCGAEGVKIASSKYQTFLALQAAGVNVVPTFSPDQFPSGQYAECVVKPDDGAGCEGSILFGNSSDFETWRNGYSGEKYVAQPYVQGIPTSLSMLCDRGQAWLLSCNLQKIEQAAGRFTFQGSVLNGVSQHWDMLEVLAKQIAKAMPVLTGYIGVDVLLHEEDVSVLEINPRLTSSYAGLHEALAYNPAGLLIDLIYNSAFSSVGFELPVNIQRNMVEVSVHD